MFFGICLHIEMIVNFNTIMLAESEEENLVYKGPEAPLNIQLLLNIFVQKETIPQLLKKKIPYFCSVKL